MNNGRQRKNKEREKLASLTKRHVNCFYTKTRGINFPRENPSPHQSVIWRWMMMILGLHLLFDLFRILTCQPLAINGKKWSDQRYITIYSKLVSSAKTRTAEEHQSLGYQLSLRSAAALLLLGLFCWGAHKYFTIMPSEFPLRIILFSFASPRIDQDLVYNSTAFSNTTQWASYSSFVKMFYCADKVQKNPT